jgi:hypothetical protein
MSEFEKLKRDEYQKRRKTIIYYLIALALVLSLVTATFSIVFASLDANTYVDYQQEGSALYHAYLNENEYYEEERLNGSHAYISSLIHHMDVDFRYQSKMAATDVTYQYQYRVDVQLVIADVKTGSAIYNPTETILGPTTKIYMGQNLLLTPSVNIDYVAYNQKAKDFIEKYNLTSITSYLNVTMYVDVVGMSELFANDNEGQYSVQVKIPLAQNVLKPQISSSIPTGPQKILSNPNEGRNVFMVLALIFGVLDAGALSALAIYSLKTRDTHIDYGRKVQKIVNNYKSFIQKINNPFNTEGYQVLEVNTFNEMLEIRDTIQMPILMYENEDKTCTTFMIPFNSQLLYSFEIKVDNYDYLYDPTRERNEGDIDTEIEMIAGKKHWWYFLRHAIAEMAKIDRIKIEIDEDEDPHDIEAFGAKLVKGMEAEAAAMTETEAEAEIEVEAQTEREASEAVAV